MDLKPRSKVYKIVGEVFEEMTCQTTMQILRTNPAWTRKRNVCMPNGVKWLPSGTLS